MLHGADDDVVPVEDAGRSRRQLGSPPSCGSSPERVTGSTLTLGRSPCSLDGSSGRGPDLYGLEYPVDGVAKELRGAASDRPPRSDTGRRRSGAHRLSASAGTVSGLTPPVTNTGRPASAHREGQVSGSRPRPAGLGRCRDDRAGGDVVDRLAPARRYLFGAWVERPTTASSPSSRRASAGVASSWPTWTPSAPASNARSGRSFSKNGTPSPLRRSRPTGGPARRCAWRLLPSRATGRRRRRLRCSLDEFEKVVAVGGAEIEMAIGHLVFGCHEAGS